MGTNSPQLQVKLYQTFLLNLCIVSVLLKKQPLNYHHCLGGMVIDASSFMLTQLVSLL